MIPKTIVSKLLWSTIEDYVGPWEVLWELNSLGVNDKRKAAMAILRYLLELDLVKLYYSTWGTDDLLVVDDGEILSTLLNDKYWEAPEVGRVCIKIGSTKRGEDYYTDDMLEDIYD